MASISLQADSLTDFQLQEVRQFLTECKVNDAWKQFIFSGNYLPKYLWTGLQLVFAHTTVNQHNGLRQYSLLPEREQTLAALRYCKPEDVKVVIVGHDPIPWSHLATGLAFSYPSGKTEQNVPKTGRGSSARTVHTALKAARIEPGHSLNHKHWAKKGVLLFNACLTIDPDNTFEWKSDGSGEIENPHFKHWKNFTCRLLQNLLHQNRKDAGPPIFVLCWGTHARDVKKDLQLCVLENDTVVEYDGNHSKLRKKNLGRVVIASGHHPTFPYGIYGKNKFLTQAKNQFTAIKRIPQYSTLFDKYTVEELTADLDNLKTDDSTN